MSTNPMSAKAVQVFRGGADRLGVWGKHLGSGCCDGAVPTPVVDRLVPTINPENGTVHSRPYGNKYNFSFGDLNSADKQAIVTAINTHGVGTQLEVLVIPTFSFATSVNVVVHAEEAGLAFKLTTRNGLKVPSEQKIMVKETEGGVGCASVTRVQSTTTFQDIGALNGATRVYHIGTSTKGEFSLDSDVYILEVISVPAGGVKGHFDIEIHANFINAGRSEAL
jgi:hypothetical protein